MHLNSYNYMGGQNGNCEQCLRKYSMVMMNCVGYGPIGSQKDKHSTKEAKLLYETMLMLTYLYMG